MIKHPRSEAFWFKTQGVQETKILIILPYTGAYEANVYRSGSCRPACNTEQIIGPAVAGPAGPVPTTLLY